MPDPLTIRPATPGDGPTLGRLGALLVDTHHAFDPRRFIPAGAGTAEAYGAFLVRELDRADALVLAAEAGGTVVGYAYAGIEGTDWMDLRGPAGVIYDLLVDPSRRREGIGRRLLEAVRAGLIERGAPQILLSRAERNAPAQALFGAAGFRRTMIEMTWDPATET